jgi:flagellar assembly protein FliH
MILLSNLIKSNHVLRSTDGDEQRRLETKQISKTVASAKLAGEEVQQEEELKLLDFKREKSILQEEIAQLEHQHKAIQAQASQEKEDTGREIEEWWKVKQEEVRLESQRLKEEASQQGYQEGYEKGYREIQQEFEEKMEEMKQIVELAYKEKEKIIQSSESFLLALSVKIAEKIVRQELKQHKEQVLGVVQAGLQQAVERGEIIIEISPHDYSFLLSHVEELEQYISSGSELKVIPAQAHSASSGCMIHTSNGSYDVSIDSQLSEIKKQLMAYYEERATE